jgi:Tol biopolymer transport system component
LLKPASLFLILSALVVSTHPQAGVKACNVSSLEKSATQGFRVPSPQGDQYLINKEDDKQVSQVYVGRTGSTQLTCITCVQQPGGPKPERNKMEPAWYPKGGWIFVAVERDHYSKPPIIGWNKGYVKGQLEDGLWTNMWAVSVDGRRWQRLTDFQSNKPGVADGYTGPAFTPDGRKAVWSQAIDGNVFKYTPFGRWELIEADVAIADGTPTLSNLHDITPNGMFWNEPGNFAPDNATLVLTGSVEKDAEGQDQYTLNIRTGKLTNLTNSPTVWDEHGVFSPDGKKILFMSAYPYRNDAKASKVLSIKTEFMLMNADGSGITQLTHFKMPGYPESSNGIAANGAWSPDGRTITLRQLFFPKYQDWTLVFQGACGNM